MSELLVLLALVLLVVLFLNVVQKAFSLMGLAVLGLLLAGLFRWFTSGSVPPELINATGLGNWIKLPQTVASPSPSPSPTSVTTQALFIPAADPAGQRVVCPAGAQVLNVRSAPGLSPRINSIPCGSIGVQITGPGAVRDGETWVPVEYQQVKGWAARRFLNTP
jgi:hypothetical protein